MERKHKRLGPRNALKGVIILEVYDLWCEICQFSKPSVCGMGQRKGDLLSVMLISSKLELLVINTVLVTKCSLMCQDHNCHFL